jgi:hypothetical protein
MTSKLGVVHKEMLLIRSNKSKKKETGIVQPENGSCKVMNKNLEIPTKKIIQI